MKTTKNIWKYLSIIAIVLIVGNLIAYGTYWYLPTFENGLYDFLLQLLDKYIIIILCLMPILILGLILSKIKNFNDKGVNLRNGIVISTILIYSLTLINPIGFLVSNRKIKIETDNSIVNDVVVYDTKSIEFHFNKSDIKEFCQKKLKLYPHLEYIKSFKDFVDSSDSKIIIKQDYIFLPDTFNLFESYEEPGKFDTIPILDHSANINAYIEAIDYAMTELIRHEKFRIFDKEKEVFVDYIYYQSVSDPLGNLDLYCYLPDGRKFIDRRLLWGL